MSLVTKGTMVVRDLDVLAELSKRAGCTVCFSITTMNNALHRRLEPGTPPPLKRLQALERLVQAGVNAGVLLAPIIPGITDSDANLAEVVRDSAGHGARFLGANTLYLKEGTKEHFFDFLQRDYPWLVGTYSGLYPGAFAPWSLKERLQKRVARLKDIYEITEENTEVEAPCRTRQLQFAL